METIPQRNANGCVNMTISPKVMKFCSSPGTSSKLTQSLQSTVDSDFDCLAEEREKAGQCITCGQQLFKIKNVKISLPKTVASDETDEKDKSEPLSRKTVSKFLKLSALKSKKNSICPEVGGTSDKMNEPLPIKKNRLPLTIPGLVEQGRCLACEKDIHGDIDRVNITQLFREVGEEGTFVNANPSADNSPQKPLELPQDSEGKKGSVVYEGSYNALGQRHGRGKLSWSNGDVYIGDFQNGQRHGNGELQFNGGAGEYVGEWHNGQPHGSGTRRWQNGDCYTGRFFKGQRSGHGRFYYSNGDLYVGEFCQNLIHGEGRYYYSSGKRYEGQFFAGKRHGKGKLQLVDGSMEVAVYCHDFREGPIILWSIDRTRAWRIGGIQSNVKGGVLKFCSKIISTKKEISIPEAVSLDYELDRRAHEVMAKVIEFGGKDLS